MSEVSRVPAEVLASGDPRQIMEQLVRAAAEDAHADRCTLTSLDQHVLRVEASYEHGEPADFAGHEYSLDYLRTQPLLQEAVSTGRVVTGGSLAVGRVDPLLAPRLQPVRRTGIVPLHIGDRVGAVLILSRHTDREFDPSELRRLQPLGVIAVMALRNARLIEQVRNAQQRGLETLTMMSGHVASSDEPTTFFGKMSATVAHLVGAERAAFWRIEGEDIVAQEQAHAIRPDHLASMRLRLPQGDDGTPIGGVLFGGRALRHSRDAPEPAPGPHAELLDAIGARDLLAVPWRTADRPIGMLTAFDSATGFSEQDEWIMRLAARASALVWQGYEAEHRVQDLQRDEHSRLQQHARRIGDLERQKSEFLQLASHELRTPITLVLGYLSMLEEGALGELPQAAEKVIPVMMGRLSQMNQLVDRILMASRLDDTARARRIRDVDVSAVVRTVVESFEGALDSGHRIVVTAEAGLCAQADPDELQTILANLVSNGIKYSPDGGDVTIAPRQDGGYVAIEVRDQGIGIPPGEIDKLFQPFGRLDSAHDAGVEGTGLGLYLSRSLAKANGGDIRVASSPGNGTTFTVVVPATGPGSTAA